MLVISRPHRIGLLAYQRLWLEAMELYSKPLRIRGKGFTAIVFDDVEMRPHAARRRTAANAARRLRPALRKAAARTWGGPLP